MVVVTSRDRLAGLVAADGAQRIQLEVLADAESIQLLCALLAERPVDDHEAIAALARLCGGRPAALRVAAELAASRPDESLATLVAGLIGQPGGLDLHAAGDHGAARSALARSYPRVGASTARIAVREFVGRDHSALTRTPVATVPVE
jgi:NB-ARC domain